MAFTRAHQTNYNLVLVVQPMAFLYLFYYRMTRQFTGYILCAGLVCVIARLSLKGEVLMFLFTAVICLYLYWRSL